jgi:hypothetical protein
MSAHETTLRAAVAAVGAAALEVEPYLHADGGSLYNPLTDRRLPAEDPLFALLEDVRAGRRPPAALPDEARAALHAQGWLREPGGDRDRRFRLKYVSLEADTVCNQACYFCPVSVAPRPAHAMTEALYASIAAQLAAFSDTLLGVFTNHYNEPTADPAFLARIRTLKEHGLPAAVLTNATGLTPARADALLAMGGLRFLSVNLSTLDRDRYASDRGRDHLPLVLRNLAHVRDRPLAQDMEIVVLGRGDEAHREDFARIRDAFAGSRFTVKSYEVMDRAGHLETGAKPARPHARLAGCEQTGSRPLQHLHVIPDGRCLLCCEDYDARYVVGDLARQSIREVLEGGELARLRRLTYGLEPAPADYLCRACLFARSSE